MVETIEPKALHEYLTLHPDTRVIDVRTPSEFSEVHLRQAINIPLHELSTERVREYFPSLPNPLFIVCQRGGRSMQACRMLDSDALQVVNVNGGTAACIHAGLETDPPNTTFRLDRSVRIAAGVIALVGAGLGYQTDARFFIIPALVGVGLMIVGVSGFSQPAKNS